MINDVTLPCNDDSTKLQLGDKSKKVNLTNGFT